MAIGNHEIHQRLERVLFGQAEIRNRVAEMGAQITEDFSGHLLSVVTVLQGGALFMADLIREIHLPLQIESISVASYHGGVVSTGTVSFHQSRMPLIEGRDVLVLDDILDSGRTLAAVMEKLRTECRPRSIRSAVLLTKDVKRAIPIEADYSGFTVGNEFVVGYGLDYRGEYRNLPVIGVLSPAFLDPEG